MKRYCFTLDLYNDPGLVEEYKWYHRPENFWPEVTEAILSHGVLSEEIYLSGNRLIMILQTTEDFSLETKATADKANPLMQQWESLMWKYQKATAGAKPSEKWVVMEKIFEIKKYAS